MEFRIYIETTIPSFYFEERKDPENAARQLWTRKWRDRYRQFHRIYSSAVVIDELGSGDHPAQAQKLALMKTVELLRHTSEIDRIAEVCTDRFLMPSRAAGDALHMAFASYYRCHILLTWNCAHLANASKRAHLMAVNTELALPVPDVVTPLNLIGQDVYGS